MAIRDLPPAAHPITMEAATTQSSLPRRTVPRPAPQAPRPVRPTLLTVAAIAALVLVGALALLTVYAAATLPGLNGLGAENGTIRILDRQQRLIAQIGQHGNNRQPVALKQVAPVMQQSVLAAEDRDFYSEGAFDIPRILQALVVDTLAGRPEQGASTITQQLARNALLTPQKSVLRKLREALLAQQIDARYSKSQVLEMYLNQVYFGEGAYGVEDAAQTYFGKHASQLDLAEASLLAGILDAPSSKDPYTDPQAAFSRQHYVLGGLLAMHAISPTQAAAVDPLPGGEHPGAAQRQRGALVQQAMLADLRQGHRTLVNLAPAFALSVQSELHRRFGENSRIFQQPVTVTTTLDVDLQQRAQQAVREGVAQLGRGANNGALVMLDPSTGAIRAMVGSADYANASIDGQFNVVTAPRQPGSSFKPYVFAAGFASGRLRPNTLLDDTGQESQALGGVQDWDHQYMGRITAAQALLYSRNIATEQAMQIVGVNTVINFAHQLGISSPLAPNLSTAIGSSPVTMLEHAAAYASFANGGFKVSPRAVVQVLDAHGHHLLDQSVPAAAQRVMAPGVACQVNGILLQYPSTWDLGFDRSVAGKSGTTDSFRDAWFMAYSRNFVVATWTGRMEANGAEGAMNQVFGTTMARYLAVPFVNGLPAGAASAGCGVPASSGGTGGEGKGHGHGKGKKG